MLKVVLYTVGPGHQAEVIFRPKISWFMVVPSIKPTKKSDLFPAVFPGDVLNAGNSFVFIIHTNVFCILLIDQDKL